MVSVYELRYIVPGNSQNFQHHQVEAYLHPQPEPATGGELAMGIDSTVCVPSVSSTRFSPPPLALIRWSLAPLELKQGKKGEQRGRSYWPSPVMSWLSDHPGQGGGLKLTFSIREVFCGRFGAPAVSGNLSSPISFIWESASFPPGYLAYHQL